MFHQAIQEENVFSYLTAHCFLRLTEWRKGEEGLKVDLSG